MFGMGFTEIILILIVAIIALGPEKLPNAIVEFAKFFKKIQNGISEAKSTIDDELNLSQYKQEVDRYKVQMQNTKNALSLEGSTLKNLIDDEVIEKIKPTTKKQKNIKKENKKNTKSLKNA